MYFEKIYSDPLNHFRASHLGWSLLSKEDCLLFSIHLAVKPQAWPSTFQTNQVMPFSITLPCTTEWLSYVSCTMRTSTSTRDALLCLAKVPWSFYIWNWFSFTYLPDSEWRMHVDVGARLKCGIETQSKAEVWFPLFQKGSF